MSDYMQEVGRMADDYAQAVHDGRDEDCQKLRAALLAHIERGRVADIADRISEAHDASLDEDHTGCRAILKECLRLLAAAPAAPDHSATVPTTRQYYYSTGDCPAQSASHPECHCWHDEGTGPLKDAPEKIREWRDKPAEVPMPEPYCHLTTGSVEWMRNSPETRTVSATASGKPNENTRPVFLVEQMQLYGDAREAAGYARGMAAKGGA